MVWPVHDTAELKAVRVSAELGCKYNHPVTETPGLAVSRELPWHLRMHLGMTDVGMDVRGLFDDRL